MRHLILVAGLLLMTTGCSIPRFSHTRTEHQTIEPEQLQLVDLSTSNGSISVEPHDAANIEMEVTFTARASTEAAAKENCEAMECEVAEQDGQVTIKATKPPGQWSASASFVLKVPPQCALRLGTSNGKVSVKDIGAEVNIKTSNGAIRCDAVYGSLDAETSNGSIEIDNGRGSIRLKTSNGKVSYAGRLVGHQNEIRTSNGSVTVAVPRNQLTEVLTKTSNGSIRCDLPTPRVIDDSKKSLHAMVGQGESEADARISIRTSNGSIKIDPWSGESVGKGPEEAPTKGEVEEEFVL